MIQSVFPYKKITQNDKKVSVVQNWQKYKLFCQFWIIKMDYICNRLIHLKN